MKLTEIEGIGPTYEEKLQQAGITNLEKLLESGKTPQGRRELAAKTGLPNAKILEWVNRADLFRIRGIGSEYSDLLEASGVDTVKELAQRIPENLAHRMEEVNEQKHLVRQLPSLKQVRHWVEHAKTLPPTITY